MKCSNCIKLIPNVLEGDITTQGLNEFNKHIAKCDECRVEYNFYKEAREGLKENIDIEGFVFEDCSDKLMSKIDKNKYKDKKKNKLRKNYSFLKKLSPVVAACIIGVIIISNHVEISKFFIDNKVSDKNKEITDTVNLKNINPKTVKLKSIKDSDKFIVKEIPKDYGYKEIYDKDNLIVTKSYLEDSSEAFLFNVNTGKINNFIKTTKPENYITDIKFDGNFVLWLECTKGTKIKSVGNRLWFVFVKNIKTNEVFMLKKGELNPELISIPSITLNNGIGTVTSLDNSGRDDKLFLLDLNQKVVKEICTADSKKKESFRFVGIIRIEDKIMWCQKDCENEYSVQNIYSYDLKTNEKKQLSYKAQGGVLRSYGEYLLFNDGEKTNILNTKTSKIVDITEEQMNIFKKELDLGYSRYSSDMYMSKNYIYFMFNQIESINALIYDIDENIYYSVLDKVGFEQCHISRFYCKDKSMVLKISDATSSRKVLYIVAK